MLYMEELVSTNPTSTPPKSAGRASHDAARRSWMRWVILAAIAAGVAALFLWQPGAEDKSGAPQRQGPRATPVSVAAVETGSLTERAGYPGELDADAADLASSVSGRIVSVSVRIGDQVRKGQELARIDAADLMRQRAEAVAAAGAAQAAERRARVQLDAAKRELARGEALFNDGTISEQERDRLASEVQSLEATVQAEAAREAQARARVGVLDQGIAESRLRAPFAGTVAARYFDPGSFVSAGTRVLRVVAGEPLRVRFEVPEQDVGRFGVDAAFTVRAPPTGALEVQGRVAGLGTEVSRERRAVWVEGVLDDPPETWLPGMYAQVVAAQRTIEDATIVPAEALVSHLQEGGAVDTGVFRVEGQVARWVSVQVQARDGERVAVEGPLDVGATVLVGGHSQLSDGAQISIAGEAP